MADKIEAVARAIAAAWADEAEQQPGDKHPWAPEARAAIEALRLLTPEMERAVALASCDCSKCSTSCDACEGTRNIHDLCLARGRRAWLSGVDAALGGVT